MANLPHGPSWPRAAHTGRGIAMDASEGLSSAPRSLAAGSAGGRRAAAGGAYLGAKMASNAMKKSAAPAAALTDPVEGMTDLTTSINRIAANNRNANPYEIRNGIVIEENKQRVRYENGITALPMSAQELLANAQRANYNHRRRLSDNIVAESGQARPKNACAHHIVALKDDQAEPSRKKLFDWGIAINDADNGVFLPRWANKKIEGYPKAPQHGPIHTEIYYSAVYARLRMVPKTEPATGRSRLRGIKSQLQVGAFPW